jgi:hypothetical protein
MASASCSWCLVALHVVVLVVAVHVADGCTKVGDGLGVVAVQIDGNVVE